MSVYEHPLCGFLASSTAGNDLFAKGLSTSWEFPMTLVCGLDLHRRQITFDAVDVESGESWTGRVWQPDGNWFRPWLRDDVTDSLTVAGVVGGGGVHRLARSSSRR